MEPKINPPAVGKRIRELRKHQTLSLDELSLRSGVSKSMLSQIESDTVNPTIATVWKIANGLGIQFQALLEGREEPLGTFQVTRADEATILDSSDGEAHFRVLSPIDLVDDLEVYLINLNQGGKIESDPHYSGTEEYLTVLEGTIKIESGGQEQVLNTGDFAIYNVDCHHLIENTGKGNARAHLVVRYQKKNK